MSASTKARAWARANPSKASEIGLDVLLERYDEVRELLRAAKADNAEKNRLLRPLMQGGTAKARA